MIKKYLMLSTLLVLLIGLTSAVGCGNGVIEPWEDCDGLDLSGETCQSLGFTDGYLSCYPENRYLESCTFDVSGCYNNDSIIIIPEINPEIPFCEDDLEVCAEIISTSPLQLVEFSCTFSSRSGVFSGEMTMESSNTYCAILSSLTSNAINGTQVQCSITASNQYSSLTEFISTTYDCPECGNGILERTELCDDGEDNNFFCEAGYNEFCSYCTDECFLGEVEGPKCGDGNCQSEYENWTTCQEDCEKQAICGDSFPDVNETCDLGALFNTNIPCNPLYGESCSYCSLNCQNITILGEYCGDSICNNNSENWTTCNQDCKKTEVCGDGFVDINEECDGGNNCLNDCTLKEDKEREYSSFSSITEFYDDCEPSWECSSWSECDVDVKHRDCVDVNHCLYPYNEPMETTGCEIIKESKIDEGFNYKTLLIIFVILIIVLAILLIASKK